MQFLFDYPVLLVLCLIYASKYIERSSDWYLKKGMSLLTNKQYKQAQRCFENALIRQPSSYQARFALAELYRQVGNNKLAQASMGQAFKQSQIKDEETQQERGNTQTDEYNQKINDRWPITRIWPSAKI